MLFERFIFNIYFNFIFDNPDYRAEISVGDIAIFLTAEVKFDKPAI